MPGKQLVKYVFLATSILLNTVMRLIYFTLDEFINKYFEFYRSPYVPYQMKEKLTERNFFHLKIWKIYYIY